MIKIYCGKARSKLVSLERVVAGRVGMPVEFEFSEEWSGLEKVAVFRGRETKEKILTGTTTTVAHEALEEAGYDLQIGVYGKSTDGQIVIPTTWTTVCIIEEGCIDPNAEESEEPTPSVVAQIQAMAESAQSNAATALGTAERAETKAQTAMSNASQAVDIATAESESAYAAATAAQTAKAGADSAKNAAAASATAAENSKIAAYTALDQASAAAGLAYDYKNYAQDYMDGARDYQADAQMYAGLAETAKNDATTAKNDATTAKNAAVSAKTSAESAATVATQKANSIQYMTAEATTGEAGSQASVAVTGGSGTPYLLSFTIPKGDQGETYDDTEIRGMIAGKADASATYTKTEVDTALSAKANTSTTYTKTEVNNALAGKANSQHSHVCDDITDLPSIPQTAEDIPYGESNVADALSTQSEEIANAAQDDTALEIKTLEEESTFMFARLADIIEALPEDTTLAEILSLLLDGNYSLRKIAGEY